MQTDYLLLRRFLRLLKILLAILWLAIKIVKDLK